LALCRPSGRHRYADARAVGVAFAARRHSVAVAAVLKGAGGDRAALSPSHTHAKQRDNPSVIERAAPDLTHAHKKLSLHLAFARGSEGRDTPPSHLLFLSLSLSRARSRASLPPSSREARGRTRPRRSERDPDLSAAAAERDSQRGRDPFPPDRRLRQNQRTHSSRRRVAHHGACAWRPARDDRRDHERAVVTRRARRRTAGATGPRGAARAHDLPPSVPNNNILPPPQHPHSRSAWKSRCVLLSSSAAAREAARRSGRAGRRACGVARERERG
jgi:hypothetical protein